MFAVPAMTLVLPSEREICRSTDGVGAGPGGGVGGGGGGGVPAFSLTNLNTELVCNVSKSITPEAESCDKSLVDVVMQYCTAVPAGCGGICAVYVVPLPTASVMWDVTKVSVDHLRKIRSCGDFV